MNIYFKDSTITVIEQQPMMMPFDLVSNIGGILGLFVGMSILSMCEVVQFVVELFVLMVSSQNRKKGNKTDPM